LLFGISSGTSNDTELEKLSLLFGIAESLLFGLLFGISRVASLLDARAARRAMRVSP
jgi:hypothetical protein